MVLQLKMRLKQKLGVMAMFALGIFVVISGSTCIRRTACLLGRARANNSRSHPRVLLQEERDHADLHRVHGRDGHSDRRRESSGYVSPSPCALRSWTNMCPRSSPLPRPRTRHADRLQQLRQIRALLSTEGTQEPGHHDDCGRNATGGQRVGGGACEREEVAHVGLRSQVGRVPGRNHGQHGGSAAARTEPAEARHAVDAACLLHYVVMIPRKCKNITYLPQTLLQSPDHAEHLQFLYLSLDWVQTAAVPLQRALVHAGHLSEDISAPSLGPHPLGHPHATFFSPSVKDQHWKSPEAHKVCQPTSN